MNVFTTPGFHHLTFVSSDASRTEDFYGDLLGLRLVDQGVREGPGPGPTFTTGDGEAGTLIAFKLDPDARRGRWGVGGIHHLALAVTDEEALLRWKRRLSDRKVGTTGPYDRGYFTSLYFRDPDGHILELATRGPGYAIDEEPDRLGERFITPPDERVKGHRDEAAIARAMHPEPVPDIDAGMRIGPIHHVTGITDDLDAAHALWADVLGLPLIKRTVNQDDGETKHFFWANYDGERVAPASSMTLFGWPGSDHFARAGVGQTARVSLRAGDSGALDGWLDHLRGAGVQVRQVGSPVRALRFTAPDGLELELLPDSEAPQFDP